MSTMNGEPVRINELEIQINGYDNPNFENDDNLTIGRRKKNKKHVERDNIKESKKTMVGFFEMFSYADGFDIFLMVVGFIAALANGLGLPIRIVIFGGMTDSFVKSGVSNASNASEATMTNTSQCLGTPGIDLEAEMTKFALYYSGVGLASFILSFIQVWTFFLTATRQTARIRKKFFYAILHQEISWFDTTQIGTLNTRLTDDINTIREGLGDKMCMFAQNLSTFVSGMIIGFVYGWKLTLVILSICPLLAASAAIWSKLLSTLTAKELSAYAKAGALAEEILGAIRTVVAFNGQQKAVSRYEVNLQDAKKAGMKKCFTVNIAMGISQCITFSAYGLGFWYGTKLTVDESANYTIGRVLTIFFVLMMGSFSLGQTAPNLESVASSRVAAYEVFKAIKKERRIDSSSTSGNKPDRVIGRIEFRNIHFSYPTRPDIQILKGLNLKVETGKTIALVGSSGCGKSTTIQLLQRFYDPLKGAIFLDGQDIRSLNIKWLREHIGVVSQEPILFCTTIAENIRYGREDVTEAEIEQAAKEANAYDFISKLPIKFNTMVGERGSQLSGGQKQRIAIARALVRNPKILLLDEATSALDTESESIVQAALDQARAGRTTILIAHRLSTVRTADVIAGLENGVVVEQGSHSELMDQKGLYYSLVMQQSLHQDSEEEEVTTENETDDDEFDNFNGSMPDNHAILSEDAPRRKSVASTQSRSSTRKSTKKRKFKKKAKKVEEGPEDLPDVPFIRVLGWNKPEWCFLILTVIAAAIAGGIYPTFAILFGKIIGAFQESDGEKRSQKTALIALMFFVLGLISLVVYVVMGYTLGKAGENLTMRLRSLSFKALLQQEIGWFDDHKNAVGVWITRLATDASQAKGAIGGRLCVLTMSICTLLTAVIIAFVHGWQFTLLILACVPFLIGSYAIKAKSMAGHAAKDQAALEEAGRISTEAVENIRTVVSLTREDAFYERYAASLNTPYKDALKTGPVYGLVYGMSQCMQYFVNAAVFRFGAWLIVHCYTEFENMFIVFAAIVFAAMSVGQSGSTAPDFGKAKVAVQRIAKLLDRQPQIDSCSKDGKILDKFDGEIEFRDTKFVYPTRPNVQVLQGLNLRIAKGKTLALVGSSGCGKSTTIQLLERFYDPIEGCVLADGTDTKSLNLKWFRSQLGIVSQEPILFDCSIAENIQYGDNDRTVTQEEIEDAAKAANIHNFIVNLPEKYNTRVGDKGAQLSGGQKQRIAIARALVRKPKVLLLDEATSALDTESEKIVQKALDDARVGRTCIVIAHRLTTVKNADVIAVIQHGKVVEQGTHSDLLAKQGVYYTLVNTQVSH